MSRLSRVLIARRRGFIFILPLDPYGDNWGVNSGCTLSNSPCAGPNYETCGFARKNGVIRPLPTLGGDNALGSGGANAQNQMVGMADATADPTCQTGQAFGIPLNQVLDWEPVVPGPKYGEIHELPLYPGDHVGAASAINDQGQAVGESGICTPPLVVAVEQALLWDDGSPINLENLGGTYDNLATGINDRGQVVGWSDLPRDTLTNGTTHASLWQTGVMTDLGTLPGDASTLAYGINDSGQVVGRSCDQDGDCRVVLWQNGALTDLNATTHLNTPGSYYLPLAEGVKSRYEIVGYAVDQSTGDTLGSSAVPCDNVLADNQRCSDGGRNALGTDKPKAVWPGNPLGRRGRRGVGVFGRWSAPRWGQAHKGGELASLRIMRQGAEPDRYAEAITGRRSGLRAQCIGTPARGTTVDRVR